MNELKRALLDKPDMIRPWCIACGKPSTNHHHVIPKGMGGLQRDLERRIPLLSLCGMGNASGCHGLAHSGRLHFRWDGCWEFLRTEPCKYEDALRMDGWTACIDNLY